MIRESRLFSCMHCGVCDSAVQDRLFPRVSAVGKPLLGIITSSADSSCFQVDSGVLRNTRASKTGWHTLPTQHQVLTIL